MFRGKSISENKWVYGNLISEKCISFSMGASTVDPETIGMYTGLIDKNGTRVFDGDILGGYLDAEHPDNQTIVVVVWNGFGWCTQQHPTRGSIPPDPMEKEDGNNFSVIGNIYDNPELLKGEQS